MLVIAIAALLTLQASGQPPENNLVDPLLIQPNRTAPPPPSVGEIISQWNRLAKTQPDRVVCVQRASTGSRIRRPQCDTLRGWYREQFARQQQHGEAPLDEPPTELIDLITDYYAKSANRLRAMDRALERQEAEATTP